MNWQKYLDDFLSISPWVSLPDQSSQAPRETLENLSPNSVKNLDSLTEGRELPEFGVNLVGFARAELGLGEDLRTMAHVCEEIPGLPFCIYRLPYPGQTPELNTTFKEKKARNCDIPSAFIIYPRWNKSAFVFARSSRFRKSYRIGFWPWELSSWAPKLEHCFDEVDEVWALSDFIAQTYRKATSRKVRKVPLPVYLPPISSSVGEARLFPKDQFIFLATFDSASSLKRKNPLGVVKAFQMAFSQSKDVVLVLKTMRADLQSPEWQEVQAAINADPRIVILNQVFNRDEILGLMNNCDAYVSLHRSEGFGRGMAEAMLLGKPVIATNYSGNTDFCLPSTALLVDYKISQLKPGDYHFANPNSEWAEPDLEHAAQQMRVAFQRKETGKMIEAAKQYIDQNYSPRNVAQKIEKYLNEV